MSDRRAQLHSDYAETLAELERNPPPCVGCQHYQQCAARATACMDFAVYVEPAFAASKDTRLLARIYGPRESNRQVFKRIFNTTSQELL